MSIRRTYLPFEEKYTQIPNQWVRDERLTRKARGLLVEMMSHRVGWDITIESLIAGGTEGRDAVRSGLAELEHFGYLRRERERREDGTLAGADYEICDPWSDEPASDDPTLDDQPLKKTIIQEDHSQEPPPTPSAQKKSAKKRIPLPEDWAPSAAHQQFATTNRLNLALEVMKFKGHAEATGREMVSWNGAFTTWLANALGYRGERAGEHVAPKVKRVPTMDNPYDENGQLHYLPGTKAVYNEDYTRVTHLVPVDQP